MQSLKNLKVGASVGSWTITEELAPMRSSSRYAVEMKGHGVVGTMWLVPSIPDVDLRAHVQSLANVDDVFLRIYSVEPEGDWWIVVTEQCQPLTVGSPRHPAAMVEVLYVASQVARAVAAVTRSGQFHVGLQPDGLFLARPERRILINPINLLQYLAAPVRTIMGWPSHIAPEFWLGERDHGCQADVYVLGILLFEWLTQRHPLGPPSDSLNEWGRRHVGEHAVDLRMDNAPPRIAALLKAMLSRDPMSRPSIFQIEREFNSALELLDESKIVANRVFISFHRRDAKWARRLRTHLGTLEETGHLEFWDESSLLAGSDVSEVEVAMARSRLVVLFVSAEYLASDLFRRHVHPAIQRKRVELERAELRIRALLDIPQHLIGDPIYRVTHERLLRSIADPHFDVRWIATRAALHDDEALASCAPLNDPSRPLAGLRSAQAENELVRIASIIRDTVRSSESERIVPSNPGPIGDLDAHRFVIGKLAIVAAVVAVLALLATWWLFSR